MIPRMKTKFVEEIKGKVASTFGIKNVMALPHLDKIVLNVGMGKELEGTKLRVAAKEQVLDDLAMVTGQKPVIRKAKRSVSNFKLRKGYEVGAMVTLRGNQMWEFADRLIALAIPRIKDFRGLSPKSFDGRGNYSFGITEQAIFPEVNMALAKYTHGMDITFVFKNSNNDISRFVLKEMGMPFKVPEVAPEVAPQVAATSVAAPQAQGTH